MDTKNKSKINEKLRNFIWTPPLLAKSFMNLDVTVLEKVKKSAPKRLTRYFVVSTIIIL
tara:strand:+ start:39 stop:215 length:177 start_codon:yes stop_codon:yes gene_type:complete